ncbi:hypothetical protein CHS0354_015220 [Potamilus streckersoni]|uniref:Uncharacterized protein n=1 Tax=Potamilus streckersoni TaxID=2493646 RepID=A0AAE0VH84_9BIVA|nr:hypothetical protein CHS0354_015220 [Potamilus streckersoni]
MYVEKGRIGMYRPLILCFVLFAYSQCMQIRDEIDGKNFNEDNQSVSLRDQTRVSVGNDMCRDNSVCGYHGYKYSWYYTPSNWDYCNCCIGPSEEYSTGQIMSCDVGDRRVFCGESRTTTVSGDICAALQPCGLHGTGNYFWCYNPQYKSNGRRWGYCCSPLSSCSSDNNGNDMCAVDFSKSGSLTMISCVPTM